MTNGELLQASQAPNCSSATGKVDSDLAQRMLQVGSHCAPNQANQQCMVRIDLSANSLVHSIASGSASNHPLRIQQPARPNEVKILEQLRVVLLRLAQVITDHVRHLYLNARKDVEHPRHCSHHHRDTQRVEKILPPTAI